MTYARMGSLESLGACWQPRQRGEDSLGIEGLIATNAQTVNGGSVREGAGGASAWTQCVRPATLLQARQRLMSQTFTVSGQPERR